jgi:hypothetical protein
MDPYCVTTQDQNEDICTVLLKEDAARIVACVNACAGLTDEHLSNIAREINLGTAAMMERDRLLKLRDELLAALEEYQRMYITIEPAGGWQGVYEQGKAAITKAKGGQS